MVSIYYQLVAQFFIASIAVRLINFLSYTVLFKILGTILLMKLIAAYESKGFYFKSSFENINEFLDIPDLKFSTDNLRNSLKLSIFLNRV